MAVWVVGDDVLSGMLRRAAAGEDPALLLMELYVNSEVSQVPTRSCLESISDEWVTVVCELDFGHADDHKHGFLYWDDSGYWYAGHNVGDA